MLKQLQINMMIIKLIGKEIFRKIDKLVERFTENPFTYFVINIVDVKDC